MWVKTLGLLILAASVWMAACSSDSDSATTTTTLSTTTTTTLSTTTDAPDPYTAYQVAAARHGIAYARTETPQEAQQRADFLCTADAGRQFSSRVSFNIKVAMSALTAAEEMTDDQRFSSAVWGDEARIVGYCPERLNEYMSAVTENYPNQTYPS